MWNLVNYLLHSHWVALILVFHRDKESWNFTFRLQYTYRTRWLWMKSTGIDLKLNLGLHFFTLRLPLTFSFPHSAFKMIRSLLILCLSALGFLLPVLAQGTCVINDFEVQTNFVPEQFSGLWHLAGYNRMMRPVTRLPPRIAKITTRYVKSLYALGEDGRGTIRSSKGIFVELFWSFTVI